MTTSAYMPDVAVEIAFGSGYSTPAVDRTWTDVSDYLELKAGIEIGFGRQDERSTADANTLRLTLDNSDGRFTALRSSAPYYPDVRIGTPIRVLATPVDGAESERFVGYIEQWPVSWDGTDEHAKAEISAVSRLARLGYDTGLRSVVEETVLGDSPVAYYTLGEPEGATSAADSSGHGNAPLTQAGVGAPVTFGTATGPGTDDLTAATFAGGKWLEASGSTLYGEYSSECYFLRSGVPSSREVLIDLNDLLKVMLETDGSVIGVVGSVTVFVSSAPGFADGATHHAAVTVDATEFRLYVDGELADSFAHGLFSVDARLTGVGGRIDQGAFSGTLAHVAFFDHVLPADRIEAHALAGLDGFAGESAADRLERYAGWANIPAAEVSSAAATTVVHINTTGSNVVDAMRMLEVAEGGVLFDGRDGTLTLLPRSHRYEPSGFTLDMAAQRVGGDFAPTYDRTGVVNDATVSNSAGTVTARVVDKDSSDYLGPMTVSIETVSDDDGEPYRRASWEVRPNAEPKYRTPTLTVDLLTFETAPSQDDILAASVGTLITVTSQPAQAAESTGRYFVEGYTESIGPESYSISFNVSPSEPWTNLVIFDDADKGFDSGAVFAY